MRERGMSPIQVIYLMAVPTNVLTLGAGDQGGVCREQGRNVCPQRRVRRSAADGSSNLQTPPLRPHCRGALTKYYPLLL